MTLVIPGFTGQPALDPPHEPRPTKDQYGSHETQEKEVEHVRMAKGLAEAIPEDGQREEARREADRGADHKVPQLDPGRTKHQVDHGEGSNWEKADLHDGEHTAAGEPLTESPEPRCRQPLEPVAAHRTCQGSRECGEEADGRPE